MKITILLADAAQAVGGKLYILGGGWSLIRHITPPTAIALKIDVPWTETNIRHTLRLVLHDEDGRPVMVPSPTGELPLEFRTPFEVGRPAGLPVGTPVDLPLAINIIPLALKPNSRYVWHCFINEVTEEHWQVGFTTLAVPDAPQPPPPPPERD